MPNTSATGGTLTQVAGPLESIDLRRFIGTALAGLTGIATTLVRPSWQANPPPVPGIDVDWLAFAEQSRRADYDAYQSTPLTGLVSNQTLHEELDYLLSFYGPSCVAISSALRDAAFISQNREAFKLAGMAVVGFSNITRAPELVNDRWFDRADMTMTIRREIRRQYSILSFVSANGTIHANRDVSTLTRTFTS